MKFSFHCGGIQSNGPLHGFIARTKTSNTHFGNYRSVQAPPPPFHLLKTIAKALPPPPQVRKGGLFVPRKTYSFSLRKNLFNDLLGTELLLLFHFGRCQTHKTQLSAETKRKMFVTYYSGKLLKIAAFCCFVGAIKEGGLAERTVNKRDPYWRWGVWEVRVGFLFNYVLYILENVSRKGLKDFSPLL